MPVDQPRADKAIVPTECVTFTLDQDWVPDEILEWTMGLFAERKYPVTIFATQSSGLLRCPPPNVDVGIHPDFRKSTNADRTIGKLKQDYPAARGVRSHGLYEYADLFSVYQKFKLGWDSTQQLYLCENLRPYRHPSGMIRLPMYWEDDDYFSLSPDWRLEGLRLETPGVKVLDFHPVHLYLNTVSAAHYAEARGDGLDIGRLAAHRRGAQDGRGIFSLFLKLCEWITERRFPVRTAEEICAWV